MIYLAATPRAVCSRELLCWRQTVYVPPPYLISDPTLWLHLISLLAPDFLLSSGGLSPSRVLPANASGNSCMGGWTNAPETVKMEEHLLGLTAVGLATKRV